MSDEKPILMSAPMIQAILEGRKTQTRRVIKPQPSAGVRPSPFVPSGLEDGHGCGVICPYYNHMHLWVKETWGIYRKSYSDYCGVWEGDGLVDVPAKSMPQNNRHNEYHVVYRADGYETEEGERWRPSIFMPRWASRITLEVTSVKVERVQDITQVEAMQEGTLGKHSFAILWDSINGKRAGCSWQDDPFVWCVSFRRI